MFRRRLTFSTRPRPSSTSPHYLQSPYDIHVRNPIKSKPTFTQNHSPASPHIHLRDLCFLPSRTGEPTVSHHRCYATLHQLLTELCSTTYPPNLSHLIPFTLLPVSKAESKMADLFFQSFSAQVSRKITTRKTANLSVRINEVRNQANG